MRELLSEVLAVMKGNKMRIALTGFSIAWGIFIFIVLISAGRGLINGMNLNFKTYNIGIVTLYPRETSQSFEGRSKGRVIRLYEEDAAALDSLFGDTVVQVMPVVSHVVQARRGMEYTNTVVDGYTPGYAAAPNTQILEGRDINDLDIRMQRKVCVIPNGIRNAFFRDDPKSAVGNVLQLDGINFQIVGIYEPVLQSNPTRTIVAPLSTVKTIWCPEGELSRLSMQTNHLTTAELNKQFNDRVLAYLGARKGFAPTDKHAVKIFNLYELPVLVSNILMALSIFVLVVGLATLLSGIAGVSNIMLIAVRERTQELGIRRAMGAKPHQIVVLVMAESVIICLLFGYVGMFLGIELMELVAKAISMTGNSEVFCNPTVSLEYVLAVTGIMVVAGLVAGYVPAKQAVSARAVEAMDSRQTIRARRGQRLMTAFGVFWGIVILILLIGSGMGLDNGIIDKVKSLPPNEMWIYPSETSMAYKGFGRDRKWLLNSHDEEMIRQRFGSHVLSFSALSFAGYQDVAQGDLTYQYQVTGVVPGFFNELPQRLTAGRFINDIDIREKRKVCVIGDHVAEVFFGGHEEALGRMLKVNGMSLTVVGVTHCTNRQVNIGIDLSESVLMPLPTQQAAYGRGDEIDLCSVIMDETIQLDKEKERVLSLIRENHSIHPDDQLATTVAIVSEQTKMFGNLFVGTRLLIWIVGLGTLIAGLIGISNIMLVTVRERTQEIGILRAIGAKPFDIFKNIMTESLVLTLSAGLTGLCTAVWVLDALARALPQGDDAVFTRPIVPFWTAIGALLILVAGGLMAGWIPARRALAIKPIDALREE
jgi:putative ABC transport system permease protein